ncbi:uncharacterized protein LOC101451051 isoform X2 [Ceratitis capitata]|uniref:(Mediterranean fruit fly) hypothetical protein n=1 Tax=Ceratitis capitata TaxID=7213 RepID=W8BLQ0_CERCA|nr:uncharacterized protein LOC101451051 isoform X2 [Ceratitis capitata]CAD7012926.1 unnamed protein product [Ceratitis capitata]
MNSSAYDPNIIHQDHPNMQHTTPRTAHLHHHNISHPIGSFFLSSNTSLPISEQQQSAQLQLPNVSTCTNNGSEMTTQSQPNTTTDPRGIFSPRQMPINNALGKNFFNPAVAGIQPPAQRFFGGITPTVTTSVATNPVQQASAQQHQPGNTILITNNFSTHQFGATSTNVAEAGTNATTGIINSIPPTASPSSDCYHNGNANNIRIITTLPSVLHHHQHQQQQQNAYDIVKDVEATVRDEMIQLPQFYHTPHSQSTYGQHLAPSLSTNFGQHHFAASATSPASMQISQNEQQQHQFFMFTNDNDRDAATTNSLPSVAKLIPSITEECSTVAEKVTTSPAMISSSANTTNSNSTLVLDRINICINNHYSDSLGPSNTLCTTTLDTKKTTANSAITSTANTYTVATHAPQQPSPIIPAIHHKLVLEPAGSGISNGIHSDPYTNNNSALVIDEPDSTTTTPHTPPTTPENSSSPPLPVNSISTRNTPQSVTGQIIVEDSVAENKSTFTISTQITDSSAAMKAIANKIAEKSSTGRTEKTFVTLTQSIDLVDKEVSEYVSNNVENENQTRKGTKTDDLLENSIMEIVEIDDSEMHPSTQETMRTENTITSGETASLSTHENLQDKRGNLDMKRANMDSPQLPAFVQTTLAAANKTASTMTLLTPPTPPISSPASHGDLAQNNVANSFTSSPDISFSMGEDVFIRKEDGRQYLGTVIGSSAVGEFSKLQKVQYLIRFDDSSELWCGSKEMRRLESNVGNSNTHMCVACKRKQIHDVVEICEDCRRGYHRTCTRETTPGSGVWWCLRCSKPMKDWPIIVSKTVYKPLNHHNRNYVDVAKTSPSSLKRRNAADVYEFHVEDNEIFTSDDEIPIKHIIDKVRKSKEPTLNSNSGGLKVNPTKKHNISESIICDPIVVIADENANDANSLLEMPHTLKKEKFDEKDLLISTQTNCVGFVKQVDKNKIEIIAKNNDCLIPTKVEEVNSTYSAHSKVSSGVVERSSRKRKAFTLSNSYKAVAAEAASKRYDTSRICDSSSDENSSSSRGTSLDVIIPPPKNFLGLNNPFRIVTPKKNSIAGANASGVQSLLNFNRSGTMIKSSIFNTTALDFSSKLAALKSAGMFPNLSTSNLAKAAGQPRTVRTIKRRLSAKDITIGPNQEVRRRRTRRLSSNVEVISTTTINPIPSNFFPIHAKDLLPVQLTTTRVTSTCNKQQQQLAQRQISLISSSSSALSSPPDSVASSVDVPVEIKPQTKPSHGRRLRQRPQQKNSPAISRRSSVSSASTSSSTNSSSNITLAALQQQQALLKSNTKNSNNMKAADTRSSMQDLKQSVKEYFGGVMNRIESGEQFCIRAKRQLASGQTQYLIEWGDVAAVPLQGHTNSSISPTNLTMTIVQDQ